MAQAPGILRKKKLFLSISLTIPPGNWTILAEKFDFSKLLEDQNLHDSMLSFQDLAGLFFGFYSAASFDHNARFVQLI